MLVMGGVVWAAGATIGSCRVFPVDNIWNARVDQLVVSSDSSTYVNTIGSATMLHPDFGTVWDGAPNGIRMLQFQGPRPSTRQRSVTPTKATLGLIPFP